MHIKDNFTVGAPISQVPAAWFNSVAKFVNNLVGGYNIQLEKHDDGSPSVINVKDVLTIDASATGVMYNTTGTISYKALDVANGIPSLDANARISKDEMPLTVDSWTISYGGSSTIFYAGGTYFYPAASAGFGGSLNFHFNGSSSETALIADYGTSGLYLTSNTGGVTLNPASGYYATVSHHPNSASSESGSLQLASCGWVATNFATKSEAEFPGYGGTGSATTVARSDHYHGSITNDGLLNINYNAGSILMVTRGTGGGSIEAVASSSQSSAYQLVTGENLAKAMSVFNLESSGTQSYKAENAKFTSASGDKIVKTASDGTLVESDDEILTAPSTSGIVYCDASTSPATISAVNVSDTLSQTLDVVSQVTWNGTRLAYKIKRLTIEKGLITSVENVATETTIDTPTVITWS